MPNQTQASLVGALVRARFKDLEPLARALEINPMRYGPKVQLALAIASALLAERDADTLADQLLANIEVTDLPGGIVGVGDPERGYMFINVGDDEKEGNTNATD